VGDRKAGREENMTYIKNNTLGEGLLYGRSINEERHPTRREKEANDPRRRREWVYRNMRTRPRQVVQKNPLPGKLAV